MTRGEGETSEAALRREEKEREKEELMAELWPRETKSLIEYEVQVGPELRLPLPISQDLMGRRWANGIGNIVWDAAVAMYRFFQSPRFFPPGTLEGKRILELGSGTGIVGITMAMLGAEVYLTDLEEVLEILYHNVDQCFSPLTKTLLTQHHGHPPQPPHVQAYKWGDPVEGLLQGDINHYDLVVGSDITYNKDALPDLLKTLAEVCGDETDLYIGHLERGDEHQFFEKLALDFQVVKEVHKENVAEDGIVKGLWVHIYHARKKRPTF